MTASRDESFIASTYYESMRDNFTGYAWELNPANPANQQSNAQKAAELALLKEKFAALDPLQGNRPKLGQLFEIELELIWLVPKTALQARFWTIEDRFHRVVPKGVARSYKNSFTGHPVNNVPEEVLRQRARNLLDVIHANYLINLAREILIRRLMAFLTLAAVVVLAIGIATVSVVDVPPVPALVVIILTGMAGAMISIIQRLQKATSRDAMVDDGIFELIGLRIGWVSIFLSVAIGGVLALFIYVLLAGGLLEAVLPKMQIGNAPPLDPAAGNAGTTTPACATTKGEECKYWADRMYRSLGLRSQGDLFKLIVYAFASGFAERFVPDIITKLTKDVIPTARSASDDRSRDDRGRVSGRPGDGGGNGGDSGGNDGNGNTGATGEKPDSGPETGHRPDLGEPESYDDMIINDYATGPAEAPDTQERGAPTNDPDVNGTSVGEGGDGDGDGGPRNTTL